MGVRSEEGVLGTELLRILEWISECVCVHVRERERERDQFNG